MDVFEKSELLTPPWTFVKPGVSEENYFDWADEDLGCRMMVDLDLLVPKHKLDYGASLMHELGYETVTDIEATWTYHPPPLVRQGEVAAVELHQDVGEQRDLLRAEADRAEPKRLARLPAQGCSGFLGRGLPSQWSPQ